MNKKLLIEKCQAWEEWGKSHPQKCPKATQEKIKNFKMAITGSLEETFSIDRITDLKKLFDVTIDVVEGPPKEQFTEASVVVDLNILEYAQDYLLNIDEHLEDFQDLYKAALQLKLSTDALEYRALKTALKIQLEIFKTKFVRDFAKSSGIELVNETAVTRLRAKLSGEIDLFTDFEQLSYINIEKRHAYNLAQKTKPVNPGLVEDNYKALLKSNWLTHLDGLKNWCHYAIIKNHLAGIDDFLGYHIYRGRGGEGKTVEVKALKNWAVEGNINFYEGSSKDVRAGFMSRAVPDSLLSAIQEETGFDNDASNEVRKALGDIGGLIPTEQKFKDAETIISRTLCTSTTNDRRIYPQRKFLQVKFGRIDKNEVPRECLDNPQIYANQFVREIMETIPVGEQYRPFYTGLWQFLAKLNETTLINDYWNGVFANWVSKNHGAQLDHITDSIQTGLIVEKRQEDGSFRDVTGDEKMIEIGFVKLTTELMGPHKDTHGDYFSRLSQCENFIKDFFEKNKNELWIIVGSNGKQVIKMYPSLVYKRLKELWDETHNNNKAVEEAKLKNILEFIYGELCQLHDGAIKPAEYKFNVDKMNTLLAL